MKHWYSIQEYIRYLLYNYKQLKAVIYIKVSTCLLKENKEGACLASWLRSFQTLAPRNADDFCPLLVFINGTSELVSAFLKFIRSEDVILFIRSEEVSRISHCWLEYGHCVRCLKGFDFDIFSRTLLIVFHIFCGSALLFSPKPL